MTDNMDHIISAELRPVEVYAASLLINLGAAGLSGDTDKAVAVLEEVTRAKRETPEFDGILMSALRKVNIMYLTLVDDMPEPDIIMGPVS